jgi:hypothetical protein
LKLQLRGERRPSPRLSSKTSVIFGAVMTWRGRPRPPLSAGRLDRL